MKAPAASNPERGFTLLELLIVIAVIAILAALLFPVLSSAQDRARNANCLSNLHQWAVAWRVYADENNDTFMNGTAVNWARGAWVLSFTNGYPQKPPLLLCPKATNRRGPSDTEVATTPNDPNAVNYGGPTTAYDFPMDDPVNTNNLLIASYAANCWIYNPDTGLDNIQGRDASLHWRKYSNAGRASETPLFLDSMWRGAGPFENDVPADFNGEWNGANQEMQHFAIERHAEGVNIVFFDSSVRYSRAKMLWQLPWHKDWNVTNETTVFPSWMN
jgi:prepilin-type N-terminal cleavage/methylation domain-containing protein/prepilin-type processing-associated H-X9-DG protein